MGVGKEIRVEGGRGEATEESLWAERGDWCFCFFLSIFAFIECVIYLGRSTNDEDINLYIFIVFYLISMALDISL